MVDSAGPHIEGDSNAIEMNFVDEFRDIYPEAFEEIDANAPPPKIEEMDVSCFVDSDRAHDKITRRSVTGIVIFIGRTPVYFSSKRQGAIETSTYGVEFCAMKSAVEEVISVWYML